jgi:hypothetical protein
MPLRVNDYTSIIHRELHPNGGFLLSRHRTDRFSQAKTYRQIQTIAPSVVQHLPSYHLSLSFCTRSEHSISITSLFCPRSEHFAYTTFRRDQPVCECLFVLELTPDSNYGKNPDRYFVDPASEVPESSRLKLSRSSSALLYALKV